MVQEQELLVIKDDRSPYCYLPDGRFHIHETAGDSLLRELSERRDIRPGRPLDIRESCISIPHLSRDGPSSCTSS